MHRRAASGHSRRRGAAAGSEFARAQCNHRGDHLLSALAGAAPAAGDLPQHVVSIWAFPAAR